MKRKSCCMGGYLAAFGGGLLVAILCPTRFILVLAAIALVLAGVSLLRNT